MGRDIWGFIECHRDYRDHEADSFWHAAIDLDHLEVPRNYDAFGCLLGVCDNEQFVPVAPVRGLPEDVSNRVRDGHGTTGGRSASWVSWAEIKRVDWDEESAEPDAYIREYYRDPQGGWQFLQRHYSAPRRFVELCGQPAYIAGRPKLHFPEGSRWIDGDQMFRVERLSRGDAVPDEEWGPVWTVMRTLAELHGDDDVRLVVWFDD
ncbi:hypothetical protein [Streptomyces sp. NBC_01237]|uniref:hypothetical protein n=1 Tax=Streptomyces sp. NBC_01237 TaxID=2903790 RepID=UPI002DD87393|nr:hypothetical protein [Streptomyces sp. NBC_01237]WRZ77156.1 hypothetical protein OG251_36405 [Streptomyces sp. NBC_01237]WRZ78460.1 hypothetical protein OG251_43275 [Streptomyces sp. NBC_01237]